MGNCVERFTYGQEGEITDTQGQDQEERIPGTFVKEDGGAYRVKILLTKEELEWLLFQLKNGSGGNRLEDVFGEIEKGRGKVNEGWKPSLESIMESPEVHEMDR